MRTPGSLRSPGATIRRRSAAETRRICDIYGVEIDERYMWD